MSEPRAKDWFTVEDAADYLGVSQPTIFRWMKAGLLSFFKIGGATRFSREGLDAVIQKTTGLREAETVAGRCPVCGHSILVDGSMQGAGHLFFKPARTKFWVFAQKRVPTRCRVCTACGNLQMRADTSVLKRVGPGDGTANANTDVESNSLNANKRRR